MTEAELAAAYHDALQQTLAWADTYDKDGGYAVSVMRDHDAPDRPWRVTIHAHLWPTAPLKGSDWTPDEDSVFNDGPDPEPIVVESESLQSALRAAMYIASVADAKVAEFLRAGPGRCA